jgi:hypothetical protein
MHPSSRPLMTTASAKPTRLSPRRSRSVTGEPSILGGRRSSRARTTSSRPSAASSCAPPRATRECAPQSDRRQAGQRCDILPPGHCHPPPDLHEATIRELEAAIDDGGLTSARLVSSVSRPTTGAARLNPCSRSTPRRSSSQRPSIARAPRPAPGGPRHGPSPHSMKDNLAAVDRLTRARDRARSATSSPGPRDAAPRRGPRDPTWRSGPTA